MYRFERKCSRPDKRLTPFKDSAILQTGIDWYGDGTYDAWYEWYPEFSGKLCNGTSLKVGIKY